MSLNGKKITAPVTTTDVSNCLNLNTNKISELCTSSRINKWSKHKPIRYDKVTPLLSNNNGYDEWAGSATDRADGYVYGVKLLQNGGNIVNLHNTSFDYRGVRKGEDWSRLGDLDGYDDEAVPNPKGLLPETVIIDMDGVVGDVRVNYDLSNTTGIDLSEVLKATRSDGKTFADMYPCVLITIGTVSYVRALWNMRYSLDFVKGSAQSYAGYTKMMDGGAWWSGWGLQTDGLEGAEDGVTATATIFFVDKIVDNTLGRDWREWTVVSDGQIVNDTLYACPEAVAKILTFTLSFSKGVSVTGASWTALPSGRQMNLILAIEWLDPDPEATYTLTAYILTTDAEQQNIGMAEWSLSYNEPAPSFISQVVNTSKLDLVTGQGTYMVNWSVISSKRPTKPVNSGSLIMN